MDETSSPNFSFVGGIQPRGGWLPQNLCPWNHCVLVSSSEHPPYGECVTRTDFDLAVIRVLQFCFQTRHFVPPPNGQAWRYCSIVLLKFCQLVTAKEIFTGDQQQRVPAFGTVVQNSEFCHFLEKNSQMNIQT